MTAQKGYYTFADYMVTAMAGSGMTVYTEKPDEDPVYPYLVLQDGNISIDNGWIFSMFVQGWIIVRREDARQINYTMANALEKVLNVGRDIGHLDKLDLPENPTTVIGVLHCRISGNIVDMSSSDLDERRKVVTWEIYGNCG